MSKMKHPLGHKMPTHPLGTKAPTHPLDHGNDKACKAPAKAKAPPQLPAALAPSPQDSQNPGVFNA